MLFNSIDFLIFFPVISLIYFLVPSKMRYIWLLVVSYFFYMCWNPKYIILIVVSTVVTYLSAILIYKYFYLNKKKKLILGINFICNIGILVFFKYFTFIFDNLSLFAGYFNLQIKQIPFDIILPVGISFYIFQALGYTIDVYRGNIKPERNILKYALFVSFFPQLVAGPIERSYNLITQINELPSKKNILHYERIINGLILMLYGLFLKMVIADRISIVADNVFDRYYMYGSIELIAAAIAFAIQIYCDFASYSIIAQGSAKVLGFELVDNFDTPYFATSIKDFWRRWHMSLSGWFRDYLYIPLGGSRCSKIKQYRNIMITFLISGLWHGAEWHYFLWGGVHGIYQIVSQELQPIKKKMEKRLKVKTECESYRLLQILITFTLVVIAWIFFRAENIEAAIEYIKRIFCVIEPWVLYDGSLYLLGLDRFEMNVLKAALFVLFLTDLLKYRKKKRLDEFLMNQNIWFRWCALFFLLFFVLVYGMYGPKFDGKQFIYFQF